MVIAALLMFLVLLVAWFLAPEAIKSDTETASVDDPRAAAYEPHGVI